MILHYYDWNAVLKIFVKVAECLKKLPPKLISSPLFTGVLSENQWNILEKIQDEMMTEYQLRREMLLKRLDVTIQSFQWSGKAKVGSWHFLNVINVYFILLVIDIDTYSPLSLCSRISL